MQKDYERKDVLVSLFVFHRVVGVQISQVPNEKTAAVWKTLSPCEKEIVVDVHGSDFVFVSLKGAFNVESDEIPDCDIFFAGRKHEPSFGIDHDILNEAGEMGAGEIRDYLASF